MAISLDVLTMRAAGDGIESTSGEETMRRSVVAPVLALGMSGTATARSESGIDAGSPAAASVSDPWLAVISARHCIFTVTVAGIEIEAASGTDFSSSIVSSKIRVRIEVPSFSKAGR